MNPYGTTAPKDTKN